MSDSTRSVTCDGQPLITRWFHAMPLSTIKADRIALVYEITGKMAADIYTKGYDDARKWKSVTSLINIVTPEFLRSPQALELSRSTNDLSCRRLPSVSEDGIPYFTHTQTPILPPEFYVVGGSRKPGWHDHERGRFLVIKEPKNSENGRAWPSQFLKGGHWAKVEDRVDPSDKNTRRIIPEYIERGVFQFHTPYATRCPGCWFPSGHIFCAIFGWITVSPESRLSRIWLLSRRSF